MIGEYVSHQQLPEKKQVPKIQPVRREPGNDPFSRSAAKRSGVSAIHAPDHNSKPGNARMSKRADRTANPALCHDGRYLLIPEIFTGIV